MITREVSRKPVLAFGVLILIVLASASMGYALEIHHAFAAVDHDGHQHSDFDLCQWVQSHTAHSLVGEDPLMDRGGYLVGVLSFPSLSVFSFLAHFLAGSRGPPSSLLI
ncbi:MAG: hypothetical protein AB7T38_02165 [Nitrospirales bacterium]